MDNFIVTNPVTTLLSALVFVHLLTIVLGVPWVIFVKKESQATIAWVLTIICLPLLGMLLFVEFGYNYVHRPIKRRRRLQAHRASQVDGSPIHLRRGDESERHVETWNNLGKLAVKLGSFPVSTGNSIKFYHETEQAFQEMLDAIRQAEHHIHLEYFIVRSDKTGGRLLQLLTHKAKAGVEVRLLYDALGSLRLHTSFIRPLRRAGGQCYPFLTINPLRRRVQINLRNHRKITVIDGRIAFTGGINIGDEYLGRDRQFGYWRDEHLRLEGPSVACLQMVFAEDWEFASGEKLLGSAYFPRLPTKGDAVVQIVDSGPDQRRNANRELIFAAIALARQRVWIATPYFIPDPGLEDALRLAARLKLNVRVLLPRTVDHWLAYLGRQTFVEDLMDAGVEFYEYLPGMMHSKMMLVDTDWGYVGSANLDNRSLRLNFEVNCVIHSKPELLELEEAFKKDFAKSVRVDPKTFRQRPFRVRLAAQVARLFAPLL